MVFANSYGPQGLPGGGRAGNSVLLGPKEQIARDANGALLPGQIQRQALDNPGDLKDGREHRFAIGVKMQHEGHEVAFVGTHLINSDKDGQHVDVRSHEMSNLGSFAHGFGGDDVIVAGDFNGQPGGRSGTWGLPWPWADRHTTPDQMGLDLTHKDGGNRLDQILIGHDLKAGHTTTSTGLGGSDHDLIQNTVQVP
jgi:endonuclease/exonuclease/phosphatase family metal-dependent hydrolase